MGLARADQNMGGALLELSVRTAMDGTSRVLCAISVCHTKASPQFGHLKWYHEWYGVGLLIIGCYQTRVRVHWSTVYAFTKNMFLLWFSFQFYVRPIRHLN